LLGRAERSSPNAPWRRAEGAGLDGEGASQAIINVSAMRVIFGHCPKDHAPDFTAHWRPDASYFFRLPRCDFLRTTKARGSLGQAAAGTLVSVGIVTLKNRASSPAAQLFVDAHGLKVELVRAILAKHIIAAAKDGERDHGGLRDGALVALAQSNL
jgi:hypothetical protein